MKGWGFVFLVLGIGSFLFPMLDMQFRFLSFFGDATPVVGGVFAVVGALLLLLGIRGGE
jgi:hypothetical protein